MADSPVSEPIIIQSHRGPYTVHFDDTALSKPARLHENGDAQHFLVDANIARLYASPLRSILEHPRAIEIEATEENKSLANIVPVFERLVANSVRRGDTLVAIGGGIIQDICCFIASTLLRGLPWRFVPTTLLAQADSCIGSKSSINLGSAKNIVGTFNPPSEIFIDERFLDTLDIGEIRSGIGEILKVHAIEGAAAFDRLAADFDCLTTDRSVLRRYIRSVLRTKQRYVEEDEFDRGARNVFNYGHSFGHAIESATAYAVPHGIAVSMGMDMANYVAVERGILPEPHYHRMHVTLCCNYGAFKATAIPLDGMLAALRKDKKNTSTTLGLIFPVGEEAAVQRVHVPLDDAFRDQCGRFLAQMRG